MIKAGRKQPEKTYGHLSYQEYNESSNPMFIYVSRGLAGSDLCLLILH